jgi:hypothetical protein
MATKSSNSFTKLQNISSQNGLNFNFIAFFVVCSKVKDHLEDLGADGRKILMFVLNK